jgi:hypothetical protein
MFSLGLPIKRIYRHGKSTHVLPSVFAILGVLLLALCYAEQLIPHVRVLLLLLVLHLNALDFDFFLADGTGIATVEPLSHTVGVEPM